MKKSITLIVLLTLLAFVLAACGDKSVYALSGNVQLKYDDGTTTQADFNGSTITVESVEVSPQTTVIELTLKLPESWTNDQRYALTKNLDMDAVYEDGTPVFDSLEKSYGLDEDRINIKLSGGSATGKEISFVLSINGEKVEGGEFKRHIN